MKLKYILTLLIIGFGAMSYGQAGNTLIPVYENNLWGFIDIKGNYIIKPRFHSIGKFSANLAPAREDGLYGYINTSGKFVIPSKYDFALSFINDNAKVYINGKPFLIDKKGKILFPHDFIEFYSFEDRNVTFAFTKDKKYALINKSGQIIIEPVFSKVSRFTNGLAVVEMPSEDNNNLFYGVIDSDGEYVVDFGEYDRIEPYANGYAKVWKYDDSYPNREIQGIINETGELVFTIPERDWNISILRPDFTEGMGIVELEDKNLPDDSWVTRRSKIGLINEAGKLILEGEDIEEITYFRYNRAFIREGNDKWSLIDKQGNIIKENLPGGLLENKTESDQKSLPFLNGIEILEIPKEGLILIDTTGNAIYPLRTFSRLVLEKKRIGNILFYKEKVPSNEGHRVELWGFWDLEKNTLTKPKFKRVFGFTPSGLIHVVKGEEECVVDKAGHVVWIQRNKEGKTLPLNIDYMKNGYIYATSPSAHKKEFSIIGGHSTSGELPNPNTKKHKFPENKFSLLVRTNERTTFETHTEGYKTYIVNSTGETVYFRAEDSRLEMIMEALNQDGKWQNIEYLPQSFCGNSLHILDLPPNHHWELSIPQYAGAFKTKLRIKLVYKVDFESSKTAIIYSNEFSGSINPAQFWRKKGSVDNMPDKY